MKKSANCVSALCAWLPNAVPIILPCGQRLNPSLPRSVAHRRRCSSGYVSTNEIVASMPVLEHEVHESVKIGSDHRYKCWNRPGQFASHYMAPNRIYNDDGTFVVALEKVEFAMSHDCRYDGKGGLTMEDPACEGCAHYKKSGYVEMITQKGIK